MRTAVIGGAGGMGRWLVGHFLELGHEVIVSDPNKGNLPTSLEVASENASAVSDANLVVISVPMEETSQVIREVIPFMKENSILCEISTLKSNVVAELRKTEAKCIQPLSIHPLFGPGSTDLKKKYALIPILDIQSESEIADALFPKSHIIVVEPDVHDRIMALTLSLPYFTNMILASVFKGEDILLMEQLSGTTFTVQFMLTSSIMSHTAEFHKALHIENNYSTEILQKLLLCAKEELSRLTTDVDAFQKSYLDIKSTLGEKLNLKEKYHEMYRVLKVIEEEVQRNS